MNPEFQRNLWLELTPRRMILMTVLLGLAFFAAALTSGKDEMLGFIKGKVANWWLPDDVVFVADIPHTATGKILKTELRNRFKDHVLPTVAA